MVVLHPLFEFLTGKPAARNAGSTHMKDWLKIELEKAFEDDTLGQAILPAPVNSATPSPNGDEAAPSSSCGSFPA